MVSKRVKGRKSRRKGMRVSSKNIMIEGVVFIILASLSFFWILPELAKEAGIDPNIIRILGIFVVISLALSSIRR
jgi:hypothetical protein